MVGSAFFLIQIHDVLESWIMSEPISITDFETWYRCWYALQKSSGWILETSVEDFLKEGDEFAVYARPLRASQFGSSELKLCLFREIVDGMMARRISDLIRVQQREYKLDFKDSLFLIVQKFILSYDFDTSIELGVVHLSLDDRGLALYTNKNNKDDEGATDRFQQPLWSLLQFKKIFVLLLDELASEIINYHPRCFRCSFCSMPPIHVYNRPEARILPDGTIEKYHPPVLANTPFLSFAASFLCFHKDQSNIKKLINNLPSGLGSQNSKEETDKTPALQTTPEQEQSQSKFLMSSDGRTVILRGEKFVLPPNPAILVEALWKEYEKGTGELHQTYLMGLLGRDKGRLKDVFRHVPNWQKLVVTGTKPGYFRLKI
jgi:hypothetical protein